MARTIIEIYNNIPYNPALTTEWGFSCFVSGANLLFDTGGKGDVLLANMQSLGISPADVERLVLSHDHWDHTGGIGALLDANPSVEVYVHDGFSAATLDLIGRYTDPRTVDCWTTVADDVHATGPLGEQTREQALAVMTPRGFLVVTGCAHPGIGRIIRRVAEEGPVRGAMGGFHTVSDDDMEVLAGVDYVSPSHCTDRIGELRERYRQAFRSGGAGRVHRV